MNKQALTQMWDHMRQCHGIAMRVVALIPADKIDAHPIPNMRTPKELLVHMYRMVFQEIAESVVRGEAVERPDKDFVDAIKTKDDLVKFCTDCWKAADQAVGKVTDAQLAAVVKTPWGVSFPGFVMFSILNEEFFHHRGQLYAYARALGAEPPMMWDFEHNAPEYQPKQAAQA